MLYSHWWKLIFWLVEIVYFCSELFFCCLKLLLKLGGPILKDKHFPASGNHFLWFSCQEKQFFGIVETYFRRMLRCGQTFVYYKPFSPYIFQRLLQVKTFFRLVEAYFWMNASFRLLEKDFLSSGNPLPYTAVFFVLEEIVTDMSGNQFLKTDLASLASENWFSGQWKPLSSIVSDV